MPWRGRPVELVPRKEVGVEVRERGAVEFRRVASELDEMRGDELVGWDAGARVMRPGSRIAKTRERRLPIKGDRIVAPDQDLGERHERRPKQADEEDRGNDRWPETERSETLIQHVVLQEAAEQTE